MEKFTSSTSKATPRVTIFNIQKGKVKLTVLSEHGKERVMAILEAGEFCGEGWLDDRFHESCHNVGILLDFRIPI